MNMKAIYCLLLVCLCFSCSSSEEDIFFGFKVEDTAGIDLSSVCKAPIMDEFNNYGSTKTLLYGTKNNRVWIGIYDNITKEELFSYVYKEKIPSIIPLQYGESFKVASIGIIANEFGSLISISGYYSNIPKMDGPSYSAPNSSISFGGIMLHNNRYLADIDNLSLFNWYQNSVICSSKSNAYSIFTQNGELISIQKLPEYDNVEPLSYTTSITWSGYGYLYYNYETGLEMDFVEIIELKQMILAGKTNNSHITRKAIEYQIDSEYDLITFDITFISGEKKQYLLSINRNTGSYLWKQQ